MTFGRARSRNDLERPGTAPFWYKVAPFCGGLGGCVKNKCSEVQYGDGVNCFLIPKHGECDGKGCEDFKCVDGYQKSGPNCENINECGDGSHDCDSADKARCEDIHPIPGVKGIKWVTC